MKHVLIFIVSVLSSFTVCALLQRFFIPVLKSYKLGQHILEIGPRWHKSKEGTPTMGGIFIIAAVILSFAAVTFAVIRDDPATLKLWISLLAALLFGAVGVIDDAAKLRAKRNEGLTPIQKMLAIVLIAAAYITVMTLTKNLSTELYIPFFKISVDIGRFYYPLAVIVICGIVNSVNLTDGIDGLAATVTSGVSSYFSLFFALSGVFPAMYLAGGVFGACTGFLVYNAYPAKIFMGDTGSLFLGGIVCGFAFIANSPLIILICGIVYVIEAFSVILQVFYYKISHGKRIFKMAPFHHHLERCGWSENKIVISALCVTLAFSALCLLFS